MPLSRINLTHPLNKRHPLTVGLVAAYFGLPQWSGGNTWFDLCRRNNGTLVNAPAWTAGNGCPGGRAAAAFNGSTAYVDCGNGAGLSVTSALTMACWILPTNAASGTNMYAMSKTNGGADSYGQGVINSSHKTYIINTDGSANIITTSAIVSGVWQHMVSTFDGATIKQYLNGTPISSTASLSTGVKVTASNFCIGRLGGYGSTFFPGSIDAVMAYSRALPASEVFALYQETRAGGPRLFNRVRRRGLARQATLFRRNLYPRAGSRGVPC